MTEPVLASIFLPFVPIGIPLDPLEPLIDMNLLGSNLWNKDFSFLSRPPWISSHLPRRLSSVRRRRSSKSPLCQEQLALSPFLDPLKIWIKIYFHNIFDLHKSKGSRHTADCTKLGKPRMSSHPLKANPEHLHEWEEYFTSEEKYCISLYIGNWMQKTSTWLQVHSVTKMPWQCWHRFRAQQKWS